MKPTWGACGAQGLNARACMWGRGARPPGSVKAARRHAVPARMQAPRQRAGCPG
jgi:hypothetical protein